MNRIIFKVIFLIDTIITIEWYLDGNKILNYIGLLS